MMEAARLVKQGGVTYRAIPLGEAQIEMLRQLQASSMWKLYREVLSTQRDNVLFGLMAGDTAEEKVLKRIGRAEGLHLAATTLDALISEHDKKAKRVAGESKNQSVPNG